MWIKSQNKRYLGDYKELVIVSKSIFGYSNCADDSTSLGEYATEERALEVLDQIQQKLIEGHRSDVIVGATRVYKESVFEMPEE